VLAIDLGTGGLRAAVVEDTGRIVAYAEQRLETYLLPNGGAEQDPDEWWNAVRKTTKTVISESGVSREDVVAVCCDAQWSVVVPISEHGEPLMRAVHWLDRRGGRHNRAITRGLVNVQGYGLTKLWRWTRRTGMAPIRAGTDALGHILFIKNELPEIYAKTHKFLEPQDYLTFRLTGRCTATQTSMLPMLVMDNRRWGCLSYDETLLKLAGLEEEEFPELIPNDAEIGGVSRAAAEELGLSTSTRVLAGINDTHASAIGAGAVRDFDGVIYIGTSAMLTCHVPFFKGVTPLRTMATMPSPIRPKYQLMAEQGTGGKNLEHFLSNIVYAEDEFGTGPIPDDVYEKINHIAADVKAGSGNLLFLPWLNGTVASQENATARAGFFNLSLASTRSEMPRAVLEGIAYNTRWTARSAEKSLGHKFECLRFAGGGATSDLWAQIHADVLGVPIHRVAVPGHTTVRGSALFALYRLGYRSLDELANLVRIDRVFEPDTRNREIYDRLYGQFRAVYKRNKKIFARLNRP
jgi:xylulokinase